MYMSVVTCSMSLSVAMSTLLSTSVSKASRGGSYTTTSHRGGVRQTGATQMA